MAYSTITKPALHFNSVLYVGNGGTKNVTGVGFRPDFVWMKVRDGTSSHGLFDVLRGVQKRILSNSTDSQLTQSGLTSFDSDGFTLGSQGAINGNGGNHVAWNWKAADTTATNNDGTVTTSVRANTTAGFSIVECDLSSASGSVTLGHGLGATPEFIMAKSKYDSGSAGSWFCFHKILPTNEYVALNNNAGQANDSGVWGSSPVNNNTFQISNVGNWGGNRIIAYCFDSVPGYCQVGNYKGNGSSDGTFVYTGFKPAWIMMKRYDSGTQNWTIVDKSRIAYNEANYRLFPNLSDAESTSNKVNLFSNGFKFTDNASDNNSSNHSYLYVAIAEEPLVANVGANGIPAPAR